MSFMSNFSVSITKVIKNLKEIKYENICYETKIKDNKTISL